MSPTVDRAPHFIAHDCHNTVRAATLIAVTKLWFLNV
jgi:hypothetical protein